MAHLTKILAVICKQLSNNIIDPLFLWYLWIGSVKVEPQWAKYPNLSVRSFIKDQSEEGTNQKKGMPWMEG